MSRLSSRTLPATAVATLGYLVEGLLVLRHPQGDDHWSAAGYVVEAAFTVSLVATALALPGLCQWFAAGPVARRGARIAQVGYLGLAVASAASLAAGRTTLGPVFLIGLLASLIGLLVLGVDAMRRSRHRWAGLLPFGGMVAAIGLGDVGGSVVLAAVWAVLAWQLTFIDAPVTKAVAV
jgi:hypothetical protein